MIDISFVRSFARVCVCVCVFFRVRYSLSVYRFCVGFDQCLKNLFCLYFFSQLPNQSETQREREEERETWPVLKSSLLSFLLVCLFQICTSKTIKPTLGRAIMINAFVFFTVAQSKRRAVLSFCSSTVLTMTSKLEGIEGIERNMMISC